MSTGRHDRPHRRRTRAGLVYGLLTTLLCASCGGEASAPILANVIVDPTTVLPGETLRVGAEFIDEDGDLIGGRVEIALKLQSEPTGARFDVALAGEPLERGNISVQVTMPSDSLPGRYDLGLTAVDQSGRRSRPLTTTFDVALP